MRDEYDNMFSFETTRGGMYNILDTVRKVERNETAKLIYDELNGHGTTYVKKWIKQHYDIEQDKTEEK